MRKILVTLLPLGILILAARLFMRFPELVETVYSNWLYKVILPPISRFAGIFPFSIAEVLIILLLIWLVMEIVNRLRSKSMDKPKKSRYSWLNLVVLIGLLYLGFLTLWGLNYHRPAFADMAGLDTRITTEEEVGKLAAFLVNEANQLRAVVGEDEKGIMQLGSSPREVLEQAVAGYAELSELYPHLDGKYGSPKPLLLSRLISYSGIYGFYFPFTGEPNINVAIPQVMLPVSTCHEMAHQRGVAREEDANLVAYLSAINNSSPEFKYSATIFALSYVLNDVAARDEKEFAALRGSLVPEVIRDLEENRNFAKRHQGPWSQVFSWINDAYLKANSQSEGVRSYSRVVDLLVALIIR